MNVLRSEQFDDIYFSPEDGLAETRYTFLKGNSLPERFAGKARFTIAESGFGTGLNFLAAVRAFQDNADEGAVLDFISFEKYPLSPEQFKPVLQNWADDLGQDLIDRLAELYPLRIFAFHRIDFLPNIRLTLIFDDMNPALPELQVPHGIDAWFLDGFAPSKNPDMWSDTLFENMARLARSDTTAATFTAAGKVKRGLEGAGFKVTKVDGFGKKREMITAQFAEDTERPAVRKTPKSVAVIGAGLAGTACAHILNRHGLSVTIYDKTDGIAEYASGNETGLYNPRLSANRSPEAAFYASSYASAIAEMKQSGDACGYLPSGALHLCVDDDKQKRLSSTIENWHWHEDHMQYLDAAQAGDIAGIEIDKDALYLPDSGSVSPKAMCKYYARGSDLQLGCEEILIDQRGNGWQVNGQDYDALILACAIGVLDYEWTSWMPLHTVRGQTTYIKADDASAGLKVNLCYGGYLSVARDGKHVTGASFQKWLEHDELIEDDHADNLSKLSQAIPSLSGLADINNVHSGWAGLRTSSKDRFPLIGRAPDYKSWQDGKPDNIPNLYISTAMGSHGIISSIAGAKLIADMLLELPCSLPRETVQQLSPDRFLKRARKKGQL